jgi:ribosomal protein L16 Arg81 hydroxylase
MIMERGSAGWRLNPGALHELCQQGTSFVIDQMDREFPAIGALSATLERRFQIKSWTNAYWSHGKDSAFKPHSDNHNVLILHISGDKRWKFWGAVEPDPLVSRVYELGDLGQAEQELSLRPGDMLYVPRGDVHCAALESKSCLHLTVALERKRVDHLLDGLKSHVVGDAMARVDLPTERTSADAAARTQIKYLIDRLPPGALYEAFEQSLTPRAVINLGVDPTSETLLVPVLRSDPVVTVQADGSVTLSGGQFRTSLAAPEWAVFKQAMAEQSLYFGDLSEALKPAATQLVGRGLLYALTPSEWRRHAQP